MSHIIDIGKIKILSILSKSCILYIRRGLCSFLLKKIYWYSLLLTRHNQNSKNVILWYYDDILKYLKLLPKTEYWFNNFDISNFIN